MSTKQVRVRDLSVPHNVHLYCPGCHCTYSATKGDYFMARPDTVMKCGGKGHNGPTRNLILVSKTTYLEEY